MPPSARRDRQVVRVLTLLRILRDGGNPSVHDLATRFNVRRETIYRDLRTVQEIGYPIVGDAEGRLSRPSLAPAAQMTIPPVLLTTQEYAALTWSAKRAGSKQPFRHALDGALLKLQGLVAPTGGAGVNDIGTVFTGWFRGTKDYSSFQAITLDLVEAIVACRRCVVTYQAPHRDEPRSFRFDPYRILSIQDLLYCVGHVPVHHSFVALAIDRIRGLTLKEESFTVDPDFDLKRYETEAFGVMWEKPMTVVVRFRADQAPYVREREWHPTQKLRSLRDGRVELTFRAGGAFEITRWILGWGDAVEVIRPAGLRNSIAAILKSATSFYRVRRARATVDL